MTITDGGLSAPLPDHTARLLPQLPHPLPKCVPVGSTQRDCKSPLCTRHVGADLLLKPFIPTSACGASSTAPPSRSWRALEATSVRLLPSTRGVCSPAEHQRCSCAAWHRSTLSSLMGSYHPAPASYAHVWSQPCTPPQQPVSQADPDTRASRRDVPQRPTNGCQQVAAAQHLAPAAPATPDPGSPAAQVSAAGRRRNDDQYHCSRSRHVLRALQHPPTWASGAAPQPQGPPARPQPFGVTWLALRQPLPPRAVWDS